jgi:hypothetical protein
MERHSPGPWVEENDGLITDADGNGVGDIYLSEDANLVCAAPDLLEACNAVGDWLSSFSMPPTAGIDEKDAHLELLQRAIAKAEGK